MNRTLASVLGALAIAVAAPAFAETQTYFGFQIGIGNAPPPPRVEFVSRPRMLVEPETQVMVLNDDPGYDMFRYRSCYYVSDNGYWYRSRSYRGPFVVVDVRRVPRPVFEVPANRWHHRRAEWGDNRGAGERHGNRGRGRGMGRGHERAGDARDYQDHDNR